MIHFVKILSDFMKFRDEAGEIVFMCQR